MAVVLLLFRRCLFLKCNLKNVQVTLDINRFGPKSSMRYLLSKKIKHMFIHYSLLRSTTLFHIDGQIIFIHGFPSFLGSLHRSIYNYRYNSYIKLNLHTPFCRNYYSINDSEIKRYIDSNKSIENDSSASDMKFPYSKTFQANPSGYLNDFIKNLSQYLDKLNTLIDSMNCKNPYDGLIIAKMSFIKPYPFCSDIEIISLAVMKLLLRYVYNNNISKGKFTIGYIMSCPYSSKISYILGSSLDLRNANGEMKPSVGLYNALVNLMLIQAEKYESSYIYDIYIRVYYDSKINDQSHIDTSGPSLSEVDYLLLTTFKLKDFIYMDGTPESFRKKREENFRFNVLEGAKSIAAPAAVKKKFKSSTVRPFLLMTLSHCERRDVSQADVITRLNRIFSCSSILVSKESHQTGGFHFHVGILSNNASKNTYKQVIRAAFPEFDGRHIDVQAKKSFGPICSYLTKSDKDPLIWGEYNSKEIFKKGRENEKRFIKKTHLLRKTPSLVKKKNGFFRTSRIIKMVVFSKLLSYLLNLETPKLFIFIFEYLSPLSTYLLEEFWGWYEAETTPGLPESDSSWTLPIMILIYVVGVTTWIIISNSNNS